MDTWLFRLVRGGSMLGSKRRDGQGEQHARDRSCFAQYRNNGFAAHRR